MLLVVAADEVSSVKSALTKIGRDAWLVGEVVARSHQVSDAAPKGGVGGSVKLVNSFN
ncbi:unannotated protein [freshwater metagenome]|uniref:Unannotated protein n=1 Tax=freshwater metagenome TaxID=449393 RepID=A0A6J6EAK8_9ZZZZ